MLYYGCIFYLIYVSESLEKLRVKWELMKIAKEVDSQARVENWLILGDAIYDWSLVKLIK